MFPVHKLFTATCNTIDQFCLLVYANTHVITFLKHKGIVTCTTGRVCIFVQPFSPQFLVQQLCHSPTEPQMCLHLESAVLHDRGTCSTHGVI